MQPGTQPVDELVSRIGPTLPYAWPGYHLPVSLPLNLRF